MAFCSDLRLETGYVVIMVIILLEIEKVICDVRHMSSENIMCCCSEPSAENVRCQKCLQKGHWTYACTGKRKYVTKESRTKEMNKRLRLEEEKQRLQQM